MSGWRHSDFLRAVALCAWIALCLPALACQTPYERAYGRGYADYNAVTIENPEAGKDDLEARRVDGQSTDASLYKLRDHEPKTEEVEEPSLIEIDSGSGS